MIALIDGDIIVYRAGFSAQSTYYAIINRKDGFEIEFEPHQKKKEVIQVSSHMGLTTEEWALDARIMVRPVSHACQAAKLILEAIIAEIKPDQVRIFLTSNDKSNYRFKIAKTKKYKGNRTAPKPKHYDDVRKYLIEQWAAEVITGEEADDAMGKAQTVPGVESVICSIDKDLDIIPGLHYNFVKDERYKVSFFGSLKLYTLASGRQAIRGGGLKWFYAQMLLGDNADNIPGITGCGPIKVFNILNPLTTETEVHNRVLGIYNSAYPDGLEKFKEMYNLLYIRRNDHKIPEDLCLS